MALKDCIKQKEFLEKKAEECGCSEEEFLDILISRDMETDCRYILFGSDGAECGLDGDCCDFFSLDGVLSVIVRS